MKRQKKEFVEFIKPRARPGVFGVTVLHDDGCRSIRTQSINGCTCNPEFVEPEEIQTEGDYAAFVEMVRNTVRKAKP